MTDKSRGTVIAEWVEQEFADASHHDIAEAAMLLLAGICAHGATMPEALIIARAFADQLIAMTKLTVEHT